MAKFKKSTLERRLKGKKGKGKKAPSMVKGPKGKTYAGLVATRGSGIRPRDSVRARRHG